MIAVVFVAVTLLALLGIKHAPSKHTRSIRAHKGRAR